MTDDARDHSLHPRRKIQVFGRSVALPQSKPLRMTIGGGLIVFGCLGFLPVLGFWMIPLGLLVLSHDLSWARRRRRRLDVWWEKRRRSKAASGRKG